MSTSKLEIPTARQPAVARPVAALNAARGASARAQERAGVTIREIHAVAELKTASELFQAIWGKNSELGPPINADLLRAMSHAGNYVSGAFDGGGRMHGALVGFLGAHDGQTHLHSHILGVLPSNQVRGAGFALKLHQRWWALDRGHQTVQWTFDPLVRRNAYFNLSKLGAEVDRYFINFYGVMDDQQNQQDDSDRVLVRWDLVSERAVAAAAGAPLDPLAAVNGAGAVAVLAPGDDGEPRLAAPDGAAFVLVQVPDDIVRMRAEAPECAHRWRRALREAITGPLEDGYLCHGVTRDGRYVLGR